MELCQPKKPSFKKAFAVPKLKSDSNVSEPKSDCIKSVKNNDQQLNEHTPTPSPSKEEDSQVSTDQDKENTSTLITTMKKPKIKKSLFQAPSFSEIDTKGDLEKKKKTKKTSKEESSGTSDDVKSKKIKKKKDVNDDKDEASKPKKIKVNKEKKEGNEEQVSKPKKTKVKKENKKEVEKPTESLPSEPVNAAEAEFRQDDDKEDNSDAKNRQKDDKEDNVDAINRQDDKEDNSDVKNRQEDDKEDFGVKDDDNDSNVKSLTENASDHADVQEKEIVSKTDKTKTTENTKSTPPKSLTDKEYEEIFQAVLDRCENTSLEEMFESLKKPVIPKPEKKSKAIKQEKNPKTLERKPKKAKESGNQVVPKCDKFDVENKDNGDMETEENVHSELVIDEKVGDVESEIEDEKDDDEKVGDEGSDKDEEEDAESDTDEKMEDETSEVCQAISQLIPDEVINDLQNLSSTIEPNFQEVNETTPEGSEVDYKIPCQKTPPPKKSEKSENLSSNKKNKLAPKQLNFPVPVKTTDVKHVTAVKEPEKSSKKRLKLEESTEPKKLKKDKVKRNIKTVVRGQEKSSKKRLKTEGEFNKSIKDKGKSREEFTVNKDKSRRKELPERLDSREKLGTWVQCGNKDCCKWRFLPECEDPSVLPDMWTCKMNKDERYNSCNIDEQHYDENEHIFTTFAEGSVVWAKMTGFPWWPAMVEIDPDTESYFALLTPYSMYPSHYHVSFFDDKVSRAWVNSASIKKFTGTPEDDDLNPKPSNSGKGFASHSKDILKAKTNALMAYDMSVQDRLKNFSFAKRYKGSYGKVYQSDDSSEEMPKTKKTKKKKQVKVSSDLIDSALKEDNDEDAVLKGFEEVLDALNDDDEEEEEEECSEDNDADEDYKMSEGDTEKGETRQRRKRVKTETKNLDSKQKCDIKKGDNLTKKQKMFIVSDTEEEMVVPSLCLDSDIFTMDLDDEISTSVDKKTDKLDKKTKKFAVPKVISTSVDKKTDKLDKKTKQFAVPKVSKKSKEKKMAVVKTENITHTDVKEDTETQQNISLHERSEDISSSDGDENTTQSHAKSSTEDNKQTANLPTNEQRNNMETENLNIDNNTRQSGTENEPTDNNTQHSDSQNLPTDNHTRQIENSPIDTEMDCTSRVDYPIDIDRRTDEVLSLEQDEQTVPGEDTHDSEEFSLEIPCEDKHSSQVIVHTIAPVTVELAYDSDPMDMEE